MMKAILIEGHFCWYLLFFEDLGLLFHLLIVLIVVFLCSYS